MIAGTERSGEAGRGLKGGRTALVEAGLRDAGGRGRAPVLWAGLGAVAGLGAALGGYAFLYEPFDVRTERLAVRLLRDKAGVPAEGLNILHLSDTHFRGADRREHAKIEQVRRATAGEEIDLLIHTGDFLHRDSGLDNVLALIDSIPKPRLGAYAVTGNHDHVFYNMRSAPQYSWRLFRAREAKNGGCNGALGSSEKVKFSSEGLGDLYRFGRYLLSNRFDGEPAGENDIGRLRRALEERGMQFLDNRAVQLGETGVYLVGIEDLMEGQPDLDGSLAGVPQDAPTVLLSHNPDIIEAAAAGRADLILAGHTHGGQIVLPLIGPTYTQTEQLSRGEASGYSRRGKTQVYVHRGLGEGVPVRFGAPPHVTFIRLLPARRDSAGGAGRDGNRG
ncbi:MAG: hypothetical protein F4Z82_10270 [Caldilineaceae bacterium SB0668_bin_21]|nr:hypothetical protein [Caldilineaceae bacterium SB0668_bin_21]MYC20590.1 hypothetical protein [Caldilineaceae bacterium SB0662_bin_25]